MIDPSNSSRQHSGIGFLTGLGILLLIVLPDVIFRSYRSQR